MALKGKGVALKGKRVALKGKRVALKGKGVALKGKRVALKGKGMGNVTWEVVKSDSTTNEGVVKFFLNKPATADRVFVYYLHVIWNP